VGALAGSAGGLVLGALLVRGKDFSVGQSLVMDGSALAMGIVTAFIASSFRDRYEDIYLISGASGALALGISYWLLSPFAVAEEEKPPVELSLQFAPGFLPARDTRSGSPAPMTLLLNGRF
jgi:hypothetical protein